MKKILFVLCLVLISYSLFAFTVAHNNTVKAKIIIKPNATYNETYAANLLAEYIEKSFGQKPEIVTHSPDKGNIILNINPYLTDTKSKFKNRFDTCSMKIRNGNLFLEGVSDRAVIYATLEFLEQYMGVRFFSPDRELVPSMDKIICPNNLNYVHSSPFMVRDTDQIGLAGSEPGLKLRLNGYHFPRKTKWGGMSIAGLFCHSLQLYLPAEKYGKEHPEYYPLVLGERKTDPNADACFSNPEVKKIIAENVIKELKKSKIKDMIDISLMDTHDICQCENCKKAMETYGGFTGLYLETVNYVADEVKKVFPNTLIETLAYHQTQIPPKNFSLRDNVVIRLCASGNNLVEKYEDRDKYAPYTRVETDIKSFDTNTINKEFDEKLKGWQKLTDKLYVWDYLVDYSNLFLLNPNLHVRKANINYFAKNNVIALFSESDRTNMNVSFNELRMYMECKLMWDPALDDRELMEDFCYGVYGEAASDILNIIDYFTNIVTEKHFYFCHNVPTMNWMSNTQMTYILNILHTALYKTQNDPLAYDKVQCLYMSFLTGWYTKNDEDFKKIRIACRLPWSSKAAFYNDLEKFSIAHSNPYYSENSPFDKTSLAKDLKKHGDTPQICQNLNDNEWFEITAPDLGPMSKFGAYLKKDTEASNASVAMIQPNGNWNLYITWSSGNVAKAKKEGYKSFDIYAKMKSAGKTKDEGNGVIFAVYDNSVLKQIYKHQSMLKEINNKTWTYVYMGSWNFTESIDPCFYMVGAKNENVKEYEIDKLIFIKKK